MSPRGRHSKIPQTESLKHQKFIFSQFWSLKVPRSGCWQHSCPQKARRERNCSRPFSLACTRHPLSAPSPTRPSVRACPWTLVSLPLLIVHQLCWIEAHPSDLMLTHSSKIWSPHKVPFGGTGVETSAYEVWGHGSLHNSMIIVSLLFSLLCWRCSCELSWAGYLVNRGTWSWL